MRAFAITGIVTASWIPSIMLGSDMRATPPSLRMSDGTRSSAITAAAPAASAILAWSGVTTSMITPPFSISASPALTRNVAVSRICGHPSGRVRFSGGRTMADPPTMARGKRCSWAEGDPLYERYHDVEWGRPVASDTRLFEKLCLEGFQSGLSWLTILRKREAFREAFAGFSVEAVAEFGPQDVDRLLGDAAIVRHRGKIEATISNARACLALADEFGSLAAYVWGFESDAAAMSKDLRARGWRWVGPTTVYSFMQAMGLVNDHEADCFVRAEVEAERERFTRPG